MNKKLLPLLALLLLAALPAFAASGENDGDDKTGSGLPIPRFASLRSNEVNLRTGPGTRYPIEWVFTHQGMPVEITAEYEAWRRVRDPDGAEGWVHKSGLSGKRMGIVTGTSHDLRADHDDGAGVMAHLDAGVIGQVLSCARDWCRLKVDGIKGYLKKPDFWGAYPGEVFD